MKKLRIGVLFGGRSGEHEVSLVSAASVIGALDKNKYDIVQIGITKAGQWFVGDDVLLALKNSKTPPAEKEVAIIPEPTRNGLFYLHTGKNEPFDVVFPVLHGTFGEDGTLQGLLDLADIPYVGAGTLGSSVGMDKIIQKQILQQSGISVAPFVWFLAKEYKAGPQAIINKIEASFKYPYFIKPSNLGSSVGISKAHNKTELEKGIVLACKYDRRVIVESGIEGAREIELSVLGNDEPFASLPGEIISSNEFYDYDAKYVDGKSKTLVPAELPEKTVKKLQEAAIKAFKACDCAGMARVDFLVQGNNIYMIELNTIPGFTSISMYPKLMEASGIKYPKLLDKLIELALERHKEKAELLTSYKPKEDWYR